MIVVLTLVVFALAIVLSAVFSGGETGMYCISRIRLHVKAERGDRRARRLEHVLHNKQLALTLTLMGTNLMNYLATVAFAYLLSVPLGYSRPRAEVYTTLVVAFLVLVFSEVLPKCLFQAHPDRLMLSVSPVLRFVYFGLFPVIWLLTRLTMRFATMFGDTARMQAALHPRAQMAHLLREGMPASAHYEAHHEMVDRALLLAETPVHRVMTPRNRVLTVAADAGRDQLLGLARAKNHSRLPVHGRHPRRIEGVAEIPQLLDDDTWRTVGERMTPVTRLDPHDSVASALVRLQRERARMAVVVDRGGYLLGIVTLKDLLEELVGELPAW
jgi:putative hemolysin